MFRQAQLLRRLAIRQALGLATVSNTCENRLALKQPGNGAKHGKSIGTGSSGVTVTLAWFLFLLLR
jgi:hypothetical protein